MSINGDDEEVEVRHITDVHEDGAHVLLDDDSSWDIQPVPSTKVVLWHSPQRVRIEEGEDGGYTLTNLDTSVPDQRAKQASSALAFGKDVTAIMDYTKLAGDMPKEQLEITGVVTVEYLMGRACTSLAGAGRIFTIFSRERVGFLRFEWLQIGQNAMCKSAQIMNHVL